MFFTGLYNNEIIQQEAIAGRMALWLLQKDFPRLPLYLNWTF